MVILCALLLLVADSSDVRTIIEGSVFNDSGQPVHGANVYLEHTYEGTSTDADGFFSFATRHSGSQQIIVQALGHKTQAVQVHINGNTIHITIQLKEQVTALHAVSITAGIIEASDESRAVVLRPVDIVTTPAAMGDIVGAFKTLPGTSEVGNDGRLFVRGGDASETGIYIDGLKVGSAFRTTAPNVPSRTRFNPNLFMGSFFSTGGYSAEYGQALSSVLSLQTVDIPLRTQTDLSMITVGGGLNHTQVWDSSSLMVSANLLNLNPYHSVVNQNFDWVRSPYGRDAELSLRRRFGKNTMAKGYLYHDTGGMSLWNNTGHSDEKELIDIKNGFNYGQATVRYVGTDVIYRGGLSYTNNSETFLIDDFSLNASQRLLHAKMVSEKLFSERFSLKSGVEFYLKNYTESFRSESFSRNFRDEQYNLFSEVDYVFSNAFTARAGLRTGYSNLTGRQWLHPRLSVAYRLPEYMGQISIAAGVFNQFPEPGFRVLETVLEPITSRHLILNYLVSKNNRTFRAEAFYKDYNGLMTYQGQRFQYEQIQQKGDGVVRGFDFFYRDQASLSNTEFWISYSFISNERWYAGFSDRVQPSFSPRHNGSAVIKRFVRSLKSQVGLSLIVNDGYVYTDPRQPGEMNSKTKPYANLSMSWSFLPRPNVIIHLASSNIPGRDNIFGYNYTETQTSGNLQGIPVRSPAPRFIMLGIFITFSSDKNANQLNNL